MAATFKEISKEAVIGLVQNYRNATPGVVNQLYSSKVADTKGDGTANRLSSMTFPKNKFSEFSRISVIDLLFPSGSVKPVHDEKDRYKIHLGIDDEGNRIDILSFTDKPSSRYFDRF